MILRLRCSELELKVGVGKERAEAGVAQGGRAGVRVGSRSGRGELLLIPLVQPPARAAALLRALQRLLARPPLLAAAPGSLVLLLPAALGGPRVEALSRALVLLVVVGGGPGAAERPGVLLAGAPGAGNPAARRRQERGGAPRAGEHGLRKGPLGGLGILGRRRRARRHEPHSRARAALAELAGRPARLGALWREACVELLHPGAVLVARLADKVPAALGGQLPVRLVHRRPLGVLEVHGGSRQLQWHHVRGVRAGRGRWAPVGGADGALQGG
mmetsp:Transcript_6495/g.17692  ORF Transcript_6495/g.17692 Transcript_6495/m.17692 type:complete len:273 (+) Transcript_6495:319-1137(+)